ncbi:uncharacterized protein LOC110091957 [Dendrobium catenatum]|nr:uncharacterized protein LOC110091957 [Dendrobium catenatum]
MAAADFAKVEAGEQREGKNWTQRKSGGRRRRASAESPDSVIAYSCDHRATNGSGNSSTAAYLSSGSNFSSTSRSVAGRCSFGSEHESQFPQLCINLAVRERYSSGTDPDPDPEKNGAILSSPHSIVAGPVEELERALKKEDGEGEGYGALNTTEHSFLHALRECQIRRHKSEAIPIQGRKTRRQRPASLDLHTPSTDVAVLSPRFLASGMGSMKKSSATSSHSRSEAFPSPGTPNYRHGTGTIGYQKGWSSERVPLPANSSRRYMGAGSYLPFNNGRVLPSKWEDAEKWIFSPVSTDGVFRSSLPSSHHRRPKSKSGPLGPPGYSPASPIAPCFDSGRVGTFTGSSPFSAGVLIADRGFSDNRRGGVGSGESARSSSANAEPYILRSASIHGCSENLLESASSLPNPQNEKFECIKEGTNSAMLVLTKDVATQMSPEGSSQSSPKHEPSYLPSPILVNTIEELESHFPKLEVRDVQVDDQVTVTRWTKKQIARGSDKRSTNIIEWKRKTVEAKTSGWKMSETAKCLSKVKREEAKIIAWENLQKAKAEAEIRKLEMKLEKRRSSSMDKILKKLKSAQKKAEEMRSAATASQIQQVTKTSKRVSYFRRTGQISSLSECFICHAF